MASSQHCVQLACSRGLYIGWRLWRLNYRTHSGEEQVDVRTHKHKHGTPFERIWCCFEEAIAAALESLAGARKLHEMCLYYQNPRRMDRGGSRT